MDFPPISFVIPCYNESAEVIHRTIQEVSDFIAKHEALDGSEIILVDDGGNEEAFMDFPHHQARLIRHSRNQGYGAALKTGIKNAKMEWIGILDADGTYPVGDFEKLLPHVGRYHMIVGQRSWNEIEPVRRPAKKAITVLASYLADYKIPDINSGMRLFHREIVDRHLRVYPNKFSFSSTMTMVSLTNLYEVIFVPISYKERIGQSSIHPFKDPIRFVTQLLRLALYFRPLRFFIPLSAGVVFIGAIRGIRDILAAGHIGNLALIVMLMGFQIFFFGLIAEIINKK